MTDLPQGLGLYIGGLGLYTEVDGEPLRCDDVLAWAYWMETADRVIGQERIDVGGVEVVVSTVFLGINHAWWPDAPPLVYESMVFTNRVTGTTERYSSRAEALAGHQELVEAVRDAITPQDPRA